MKNNLIISIVLLVSLALPSCMKKGEDDPFISLRSRKARVAGEWKITTFKYANVSSTSSGNSFSSDGKTYTETDGGGTVTGTYTMDCTFKKDGTYKMVTVQDGDTQTTEGVWNFMSGVGDVKNKSMITMYEQKSTDTGGTSTWSGHYVDLAYDLVELRNNKMVWKYEDKGTYSAGGTNDFTLEMVWEAK